ncbi:hypothetical protein [Burkholderia ubonensis]|uniref:hypothetical protein n=1 Tax=Burkholderia ubonensis TaxID=101571 RepID=UPI0012F876DE|nr:hypothetical protein [Burkholderia ubonensis]
MSAPSAHGRDTRRDDVQREPTKFGRRRKVATEFQKIACGLAHDFTIVLGGLRIAALLKPSLDLKVKVSKTYRSKCE